MRDLGDRNYLSLELRDELAADPTAGPQLLGSLGARLAVEAGDLAGAVAILSGFPAAHFRR